MTTVHYKLQAFPILGRDKVCTHTWQSLYFHFFCKPISCVAVNNFALDACNNYWRKYPKFFKTLLQTFKLVFASFFGLCWLQILNRNINNSKMFFILVFFSHSFPFCVKKRQNSNSRLRVFATDVFLLSNSNMMFLHIQANYAKFFKVVFLCPKICFSTKFHSFEFFCQQTKFSK